MRGPSTPSWASRPPRRRGSPTRRGKGELQRPDGDGVAAFLVEADRRADHELAQRLHLLDRPRGHLLLAVSGLHDAVDHDRDADLAIWPGRVSETSSFCGFLCFRSPTGWLSFPPAPASPSGRFLATASRGAAGSGLGALQAAGADRHAALPVEVAAQKCGCPCRRRRWASTMARPGPRLEQPWSVAASSRRAQSGRSRHRSAGRPCRRPHRVDHRDRLGCHPRPRQRERESGSPRPGPAPASDEGHGDGDGRPNPRRAGEGLRDGVRQVHARERTSGEPVMVRASSPPWRASRRRRTSGSCARARERVENIVAGGAACREPLRGELHADAVARGGVEPVIAAPSTSKATPSACARLLGHHLAGRGVEPGIEHGHGRLGGDPSRSRRQPPRSRER